jgi:hypothetical protein
VAKQLTAPQVWKLTRAGSIAPNPTTVIQRASAFTAAAPDGTVLLTRRDADGLSHWFIAPHAVGVDQAAQHLAQTIAGRHEEVEQPDELFASKRLAVASCDPGSVVGRDTQMGASAAAWVAVYSHRRAGYHRSASPGKLNSLLNDRSEWVPARALPGPG